MIKELVTIIIPAYNEASNLKYLLPDISSALVNFEYEVIVIDTTVSTDNTKEVTLQYKNVKYVNRFPTDSYGDAIRSGIKHTSGAHVIFMDADLSHPAELLNMLIKNKNNADVLVASRYVHGGNNRSNKIQVFMSKLLNFVFTKTFKIQCRDVSNSFRLYNTELLKSIVLKGNNFDILLEILVKLKRKKPDLSIIEFPCKFKARQIGKTKRKYIKFIYSYINTIIWLKYFDK